MPRRILVWLAFLTLTLVLVIPQVVQGQMGRPPGMGYLGRMGADNPHGDAQAIHQLFAEHGQIHRTVEAIAGGIRTVTESDDPAVAQLIQTHVTHMYDRLDQSQPIPMIGMSATLPTMLQSVDRYQRQFRLTDKGIEVTETSDDPELVAVIQEHAQEVSRFVEQGMPAMMPRRMRSK